MAGPRSVFKDYNLFFAANSFAGNINDFNPPKLTLNTEEWKGGGMGAPLKLKQGLQALDTDFSVINFSPVILGAVYPTEGNDTSFIMRGAYEDWDGTVTQRVITMRGEVTAKDEGTLKIGQVATVKISMNLNYYSDTIGGVVVDEIDVINMIWNKNGVDALAVIRNALGV
ncbi:phage major tail tube protein [Nguyenibacter vanlangensis]|uniref:Phage major tail tube protein n=1 Tax=Nguyenibacter vanlangensis TaxID=1216886 RepID=A0ABZ3D2B7_9PROT